jgi:hypothetical protein
MMGLPTQVRRGAGRADRGAAAASKRMTQRTLGEWLAYLEQLHPSAIDMGLERSQQVRRAWGWASWRLGGHGHRHQRQGLYLCFVASLLRAQGLKVGVYSSPHLLRYNERVQINGVEATDEQLCEAFAAVEAGRGDTSLTYFEMGTLAAFWLFSSSRNWMPWCWRWAWAAVWIRSMWWMPTWRWSPASVSIMSITWVIPANPWPSRRPGSSAGASRRCAVTWIRRNPCWTRRASWRVRFSCAGVISTWGHRSALAMARYRCARPAGRTA